MSSVSERNVIWFVRRVLRPHQRKLIFFVTLLGAFILLLFVKAKPTNLEEKFTPKEKANLEDKLAGIHSTEFNKSAHKFAPTDLQVRLKRNCRKKRVCYSLPKIGRVISCFFFYNKMLITA